MIYASGHNSTFDSFGSLSLSDAAQQSEEPLTLFEVKKYLRIDDDNTEDDDLVLTYISGAREQAEIMQGRDLVKKQYDLVLDYWLDHRIELRPRTSSVDLVQYKDSAGTVIALVKDTDYVADLSKDPAIITAPHGKSWPHFTPWPSSAVLIRFTAGYTNDSPFWRGSGSRLKAGMLLLISAWYNNRLPFAISTNVVAEYPFAITSCLTAGALRRAR